MSPSKYVHSNTLTNQPKARVQRHQPDDELYPKPWTFESDMTLTPAQKMAINRDVLRRRMGVPLKLRKIVADARYYWPNGVVPYETGNLGMKFTKALYYKSSKNKWTYFAYLYLFYLCVLHHFEGHFTLLRWHRLYCLDLRGKKTDLHRNIWTMVLRCVRLHLRNRFLCPTAGFDSVAEDVPYEQLGKPKSSVEITTSGKFFCIWSLIIPFSHILVQMKHFEKIFGCVMARIASKLVILCRIHHCLQFELCDQDVGEIDVH